MFPPETDPAAVGLLLVDQQNDFIHPDGAYARGGASAGAIAALPARLKPVVDAARAAGIAIISTHFTLVPGRGGEPLIHTHLKRLRPFLKAGDFAPGSWGQALVDDLAPADFAVEKVAYSAFYQTRLEWLLRTVGITRLVVGGIVTNGGVASTVRDAHVRDLPATVLSDGCAAFSERVHSVAIEALEPVAAIATCAEAVAGFERLATPEQ